MAGPPYKDITFEIRGKIGIIKFNRPKHLNSFGGSMVEEAIDAFRILDKHPDTVFTVLTGEGRFFSAGADVKTIASVEDVQNEGQKKLYWLRRFLPGVELVRSIIDHSKVTVLALNGNAVGAGAAWFQGSSDLFFAAEGAWLNVTFSALGLVPENGSALAFAQHMGVHRANEMLMFGRKVTVEELREVGLVNQLFPAASFHEDVVGFLERQLVGNDGKSMVEMKRLQNEGRKLERMAAVYSSVDALAERFVEGVPIERMGAKMQELAAKSKSRSKL
ncbi:peroxisomal d3,d2-enoyl-CoA isomerase [Pseudovirgaria hyperparasitica]|uniref:Peroxisomal d3,d2-enoyl-CoA isomerase n=1 Tax=Pseudovirgaria hyperparasitica TaxID=470096 RepID=A0A6A6VXS0_9PEZI|nr:peroxisomal d3,d2-enoyl-CoA isomerase [Pseudovirgaria hyperparasitica]KAF2754975.1 peroxisomal d3,d2-enoyl-CoA isomerase [Pseudovirgaria hyperparasitica]